MTKVGVHTKHGVLHFSFNASKNQFLTGKIYSCHVSVWETSWIYILPHHVKEYLRPSLISCSSSQRDWLANFIQIGLNLKIMNMHVNAKFLFYWHFSRHGESTDWVDGTYEIIVVLLVCWDLHHLLRRLGAPLTLFSEESWLKSYQHEPHTF